MNHVLYNLVANEGENSSVTVFMGKESHIATKDHPNFQRIVDALESGQDDPTELRKMFDTGFAIATNFERLSERVTVNAGRLFFDGDEMDTALTQAIVRFYAQGNDDFKPLVCFLEKIELNPSPHSRQHLFRWLRDRAIGIMPDGDFIAYKGVDGAHMSINAGEAMVNGEVIHGRIPNKPNTVVEMPRSKVTFDPAQGCSTGLHAGNYRYARDFAHGKVLIVKINPRDVVSVPTDSNDEKLRVCRYKILKVTESEDRNALFVADDSKTAKVVTKPAPKADPPAKKEPKGKRTAQVTFPEYYEQFKKVHFEMLTVKELLWLAKEWGLDFNTKAAKANLVGGLIKEARARLKTWN